MLDGRMMRCPYCKRIFWITEDEQYNKETFECPHCGKSNAGCSEADMYGVLIGVSILDYELQELLRG
uniref:Uncharacterized protein n=1 Tax=viral metagenome TaxID=1070528 RepID=A0A6H2A4X4_9ZZZZ